MIDRKYGYLPDLPDIRDYCFAPPRKVKKNLPPVVDLRSPIKLPVLDQGQLGSCTANAISNMYRFLLAKEALKVFQPSRLFIYYNERKMEGTIKTDSGAQIRDGFKSIATDGVCDEKELGYDIAKFAKAPNAKCYQDALDHKAIQYQRLDNTDLPTLKSCLAEGYPFVFGFSVYSAFETVKVAKSGVLNLPEKGEKLLGGHAVLCVGYDDRAQRFTVLNSWSSRWGNKGFFTIPYGYLTNQSLADDFWTIRQVN